MLFIYYNLRCFYCLGKIKINPKPHVLTNCTNTEKTLYFLNEVIIYLYIYLKPVKHFKSFLLVDICKT